MIQDYGWSDAWRPAFARHAASGRVPARIVVQQRGSYVARSDSGEQDARLSGRLIHEAGEGGHPVVGDWVALRGGADRAVIEAVLPRRTAFVRKAAGKQQRPQVVAANIDLVLIALALTADFKLRRLERYLTIGRQSGARPLVLLTKADLCADAPARLAEVRAVAADCPVLAVSALSGAGVAELNAWLAPGETSVLLGSSGAGKSTLLNCLAGSEHMATRSVSQHDGKGRHTTTHRELIRLRNGSLMIDTPGMRELGLIDAEDGLGATFDDLDALLRSCRFRNCSHEGEPGCAVRRALDEGSLDAGRWQSFLKLQRELAHLDRRDDRLARTSERKRWAGVAKAQRAHRKLRGW